MLNIIYAQSEWSRNLTYNKSMNSIFDSTKSCLPQTD